MNENIELCSSNIFSQLVFFNQDCINVCDMSEFSKFMWSGQI